MDMCPHRLFLPLECWHSRQRLYSTSNAGSLGAGVCAHPKPNLDSEQLILTRAHSFYPETIVFACWVTQWVTKIMQWKKCVHSFGVACRPFTLALQHTRFGWSSSSDIIAFPPPTLVRGGLLCRFANWTLWL